MIGKEFHIKDPNGELIYDGDWGMVWNELEQARKWIREHPDTECYIREFDCRYCLAYRKNGAAEDYLCAFHSCYGTVGTEIPKDHVTIYAAENKQ